MRNARNTILYWLPVMVWMGLIFCASTDQFSSQHTSRILGPLLHWLLPFLSNQAIDWIMRVIRKGAHVAEYAVLALLTWRALRQRINKGWNWPQARLALLCVMLYAAIDEFHQSFVPSREARVSDVMIDTTGGAMALAALFVAGKCLKKW